MFIHILFHSLSSIIIFFVDADTWSCSFVAPITWSSATSIRLLFLSLVVAELLNVRLSNVVRLLLLILKVYIKRRDWFDIVLFGLDDFDFFRAWNEVVEVDSRVVSVSLTAHAATWIIVVHWFSGLFVGRIVVIIRGSWTTLKLRRFCFFLLLSSCWWRITLLLFLLFFIIVEDVMVRILCLVLSLPGLSIIVKAGAVNPITAISDKQ